MSTPRSLPDQAINGVIHKLVKRSDGRDGPVMTTKCGVVADAVKEDLVRPGRSRCTACDAGEVSPE